MLQQCSCWKLYCSMRSCGARECCVPAGSSRAIACFFHTKLKLVAENERRLTKTGKQFCVEVRGEGVMV